MLEEPRCGLLTAWGNALLTHLVSPDEAAQRVIGDDEPHRVVGLPGETEPVGLTLALGRLRSLGVTGLRLALPVAGDPFGLPGPRGFNDEALDAGQAVVTVGSPGSAYGLVPVVTGHGPEGDRTWRVRWDVSEVEDRPLAGPFLAEAERELMEAMHAAMEELGRLDVAGMGPHAREGLERLRTMSNRAGEPLPPGYPPRAVRVLEQARRLRAVLAVAVGDSGSAVSASELVLRSAALSPLERACRRAEVAAYNAALEPGN
jgi:hypothetical protein